jgi:elongation factor G
MLFVSQTKHRAGEVDKGTTTTDDDPEEAERGITIYSACVQFPWTVDSKSGIAEAGFRDVSINLIDTPGHVDFTAEVERSLRVLDGGVVVFSAREGVEAQSETVWRQANKYKVPRLAFINKLDREGADFEAVFDEIGARLGAHPVALQIPYGQGPPHVANPFRGVIDLIAMQLLTFPEGKEGRKIVRGEIPEGARDEAQLWRERLLDALYDYSNELMELALSEESIPAALIHKVLRGATLHLQIQPVLCGSALHGIGVQPILDAVAAYLPNPTDVPPVEGMEPGEAGKKKRQGDRETGRKGESGGAPAKKILRRPDPHEPFCGHEFKVQPYKTGDLAWIRNY